MRLNPAPDPPVVVPLRRLRATLRAVVRAVEDDQKRIVLTRRGRPVAALVPFGALAALDLLGRILPSVADVAAEMREPDPVAPGLGPALELPAGPGPGAPWGP